MLAFNRQILGLLPDYRGVSDQIVLNQVGDTRVDFTNNLAGPKHRVLAPAIPPVLVHHDVELLVGLHRLSVVTEGRDPGPLGLGQVERVVDTGVHVVVVQLDFGGRKRLADGDGPVLEGEEIGATLEGGLQVSARDPFHDQRVGVGVTVQDLPAGNGLAQASNIIVKERGRGNVDLPSVGLDLVNEVEVGVPVQSCGQVVGDPETSAADVAHRRVEPVLRLGLDGGQLSR